MKLRLTDFSIRHPWVIMCVVGAAIIVFGLQFPRVKFDNDPENMLARDEYVRVLHNQVKERYSLYDFVIVGIVNDKHPDGVFNVDTLTKVYQLTYQLRNLHQGKDGKPAVRCWLGPEEEPQSLVPVLRSTGTFKRILDVLFRHDVNRLFDVEGNSVIIAREIISPSVVDNIKQAELGALKIEYLMEEPPTTAEEARRIRADALNNPLYKGTLVSEDGKALCLYIPITEKKFSYNVAHLIRALTKDWDGADETYITGLPVAEDTFGVEMLVQMATSAPLAGLTIFIVLLLFFRRFILIIAPMVTAVVSVICAMGLLIGLGYDVHIMSSMIAIFLMPIAVVNSIHILSEFFDTYQRFQDKGKTVRHVFGHLFRPMLYTSLTTMAGFGSLGFTSIPPVRVFGLHVAFGVGIAWVLTMTFIPAFIMLFVSEKSLTNFGAAQSAGGKKRRGLMTALEHVGSFTHNQWKLILAVTVAMIGVSVYGISRIRINDNPVKWFTKDHEIRVADRVLNEHFGGTYTAYLTLATARPEALGCREKARAIGRAARERFGNVLPGQTARFVAKLDELEQLYSNVSSSNERQCFVELSKAAEALDQQATASWNNLADEINYLEPEGLTLASFKQAASGFRGVKKTDRETLFRRLQPFPVLKGSDLQDKALEICDEFTRLSFREFLFKMDAKLSAPVFKRPEVLRYVERLQTFLAKSPLVGKTSSAVDALKKASYELNYLAPAADSGPAGKAGLAKRNWRYFSVPDSPSAIGQVFTQLEGMKKKDALFHLVTKDYQQANIWVQLKSGDNKDMEAVINTVKTFMAANPPPAGLRAEWAGLTYLNVVWQNKMVAGMLGSLGSSFIVVLVMMLILFRSALYGILCMIPLSVTIAFIYGLIGLSGKDYDMPVALLSSLTLGLSVDFAIHFLERAREMTKTYGNWRTASRKIFGEPAAAITRNAIVVAVGFLPLLAAPLVPYKTVGFFLAAIMAVSGIGTLLILPALVTMLQRFLFRRPAAAGSAASNLKSDEEGKGK